MEVNMKSFKEDESTIIFPINVDGVSLEELLRNKYNFSSRLLKRLELNKSIFLNDRRSKLKKKVHFGDNVTIVMEDEEDPNVAQDIPIDIIYEDFDLLIINKQPSVVVHPTKSHVDGTIANGIVHFFNKKNIKKKVRFVNRLDMDTSGALVIAKNTFGHQQMSMQFENNTVEKRYYAVVNGIVANDFGEIDRPIGRDKEDSIRNIVTEEGKRSITNYKVIERLKEATILELSIDTGRTHQIRVHLSSIGHQIIGDTLYYKESQLINRQALHSYYLKFNKPRTKEIVEIKADLPQDMKSLIDKLR